MIDSCVRKKNAFFPLFDENDDDDDENKNTQKRKRKKVENNCIETHTLDSFLNLIQGGFTLENCQSKIKSKSPAGESI